jgi:hypothetical protein
MHRAAKPSLLSGGGMGGSTSGEAPNLSGFINLVFCLFVVTHSGLLLENFLAHGVRVTLLHPASSAPSDPLDVSAARLVRTVASVVLPVLGAYAIERAAIKRTPFSRYSTRFVDPLHTLNVFLSLALPCALIHMRSHYGGIFGGIVLLLLAVTSCLKLVSWSHVVSTPGQPSPHPHPCPCPEPRRDELPQACPSVARGEHCQAGPRAPSIAPASTQTEVAPSSPSDARPTLALISSGARLHLVGSSPASRRELACISSGARLHLVGSSLSGARPTLVPRPAP